MITETIKKLQEQKQQKEQEIKQIVEELQTLSDDTQKENIKIKIKQLEQEREALTSQIVLSLKTELNTASEEVKADLEHLIEKYEREERENQSYYADVLQIMEQIIEEDNTALGQEVETLLTTTKKSRETTNQTTEQAPEVVNPQLRGTLTYTLLTSSDPENPTTTESSLKDVLSSDAFKEYGKDSAERLKNVLDKVHTTINKYVYGVFNIDLTKPDQDPELKETIEQVITPAVERYLLDFLKQNKNENNVSQLGSLNTISFDSLTSLLSGIGNFAKTATETFYQGKGLITALDYLAVHKNQLKKAKQSEILRNPLRCMEFLKDSRREGRAAKVDIRKIPLKQVGITFDNEEQPYGMSQQDTEAVRDIISNIPVVNKPETTKFILSLTEKAESFFEKRAEIGNQALDLLDLSEGSLAVFDMIGIDLVGELKDSKLIKGVLDFVLSILGFSGGLDGLLKRRYTRKIEKDLDDDKREQIKTIFNTYHQSTLPKEEKNNLKTLLKNKIPKGAESYFDIDATILHTTLNEKMEMAQVNPNVLHQLTGTKYVKQQLDPKTKKNIRVVDETKISTITDKEKEQCTQKYILYISESLAKNQKYIESLTNASTTDGTDTPSDKVLFTMISSLYINEKNVIDGVKAEAFLPSGFLDDEYQKQEQQLPENPAITAVPEDEKIAKYALDIITLGESGGNYGAVNKNDANDGVSLGILQRHKERAVSLLKRLQNADSTVFAEKMTDPLFQNLDTAGNAAWNDTQANQFKNLMENATMKEEMKKQAIEDVSGYIEQIKALGVSKPAALILLARLRNAGATRCKQQIIEKLSSEDRNNPDKIIEQFKTTDYAKRRGTDSIDRAREKTKELKLE